MAEQTSSTDWIDTAPADLDGYQSKVLVTNGVPTRYYDVGQGQPVVMTHGAGWRGESSGNTFVPVFGYLSRNYRLVVPDNLASGLTGNPKSPEGYTIEAQVKHTSGFIRDLGLERVLMVGQSRGGYLATRVALENQDVVEQLVIVNSQTLGPEVGDTAARRAKLFEGVGIEDMSMRDPESLRSRLRLAHERLSYSYDHITDEFIDAKIYMESTEKSQEAVRDMQERGGKEVFLESLRQQKRETLERLQAGDLQVPVLIYWGADDPSAILDIGYELFRTVQQGNDRTRMLIANRSGHFHYRERPEEFSSNVQNFFNFWSGR